MVYPNGQEFHEQKLNLKSQAKIKQSVSNSWVDIENFVLQKFSLSIQVFKVSFLKKRNI